MHPNLQFDSYEEYDELKRVISEAIMQSVIEEIPVLNKHPMISAENWYRDLASREVYSLVPPDFPSRGSWEEVDLNRRAR
jgi:hypothetical protein